MGIHNWSPKSKMQMKQVLLVCYEHNLCECSVGKRNCDRRYGLGDVEYLVNTDGDDSLLAVLQCVGFDYCNYSFFIVRNLL